eukprot:scaffold5247_cov130-Cylindrotheca_fusiformis.AAC.5
MATTAQQRRRKDPLAINVMRKMRHRQSTQLECQLSVSFPSIQSCDPISLFQAPSRTPPAENKQLEARPRPIHCIEGLSWTQMQAVQRHPVTLGIGVTSTVIPLLPDAAGERLNLFD